MRSFAFVLLGVAILLQSHATCNEVKIPERRKRGLLDLVVTLWCYRNKLKVPLLGINLYGCYCGTGGSGLPVDDVDRCCFLHDCCYYHSRVVLKCRAKVKWEFYNFSCARDQTKCTSQTVCGRTACECDRQLAECLTHAKPKRKHFFYDRTSLCGSKRDTCPSAFHNATEVFPGKKYLSPSKKQAAKVKIGKKSFFKQQNRKETARSEQEARGQTKQDKGAGGQTKQDKGAGGQTKQDKGAGGQTKQDKGAGGQTKQDKGAGGQTKQDKGAGGQMK